MALRRRPGVPEACRCHRGRRRVSGSDAAAPGRGDLPAASGAAVLFSLALGISSLALPLLMLHSGYGAVAVGVLTAGAAVSQIFIRTLLGRVLYIYPDRSIMLVAGLSLTLACVLPAISTDLASFTVSSLLQGLARGCFWTGSQTHVVRGTGSTSLAALARFNFVGNIGFLVGPAIGGVLAEASPAMAMWSAALAALISLVPMLLLIRLPPFRRPDEPPAGRIWRRQGVSLGCWAGVTAGGWRSLLASYVPVLLAAHHAATVIGVLVTAAAVTSTLGALVVARVSQRRMRVAVAVSCSLVGLALAGMGVMPESALLSGILLGVSGLGAGALQTLGPTLAVDSVDPEERGAALSATGLFRAAALFLCPLGVAGGVLLAPLGAVLVVTGVALSLPGFGGRAGPRRTE